jgi:DNA-binding NtrC family response regulator
MTTPTLLVIDDESPVCDLVARHGARAGFDVVTAAGGGDGIARLGERRFDLVIVDLRMPDIGGLDVLRHIREQAPGSQAVLMTGFGTSDSAVEAVKLGAMDYFTKPIDVRRLDAVFETLKHDLETRRRVFELEREVARRLEFHGMIGRSAPMQDLFTLLRRLAPHAHAALITGETGAGKELAARALHELGPRRKCRFVSIDCATAGDIAVEASSGVTVFLDRIDELAPALQAKLVRLLAAAGPCVIAATTRDLRAEVAAGRFRSDLFERLSIAEIHVPALRDRRGDIPYLTAAFVQAFAERAKRPEVLSGGVTSGAERVLLAWPWDGNVRELRNIVERACILSDGGPITERELRLAMPREAAWRRQRDRHPIEAERTRADAAPLATLSSLERDHVLRALARARGNKKAAAAMLGVSRRAFYRRLERLALGDTIVRRAGADDDAPEMAEPTRQALHA